MELVTVNNWLDLVEDEEGGRTKAVVKLSSDLGVTVATLYRWLKTEDHFIEDDQNLGLISVFKLVKCNEVK